MTDIICKHCEERGKPWTGDDPACAFPNGWFSTDNWNCATMNKLRQLAREYGYNYRDDNGAASIGVLWFDDDEEAGYVVMTWYKERGRTGQAYVMHDDRLAEPLTLDMAYRVLDFWDKRIAKGRP